MKRSLHLKLVLIMLLLIVSLMTVVCAFLVRGVLGFYLNDFYEQMHDAFSLTEFADGLRGAAAEENGAVRMGEIIGAYVGVLGINAGSRNYYILNGETGTVITGSDTTSGNNIEITPNILTALNGKAGYASDSSASYMDVALPINGENSSFIVYIRDNKQTVRALNMELFLIIMESLIVGLIISIFLSFLLSKTMVTPIESLTHAAEKVANGDFSSKLETNVKDEIGVLANTFNNMANQLEETLEKQNKAEALRREFVANVSHELRTPIASIRSYAETLADGIDSGDLPRETEQDFLKVIVTESDRMTKIVEDLLTLSRLDANRARLITEPFNINKSIEDVYTAFVLEAIKRGHNLVLDLPPGLPEINGDRAKIEQVLINIISNAVKYTPDGGNIAISAGSGEGKVRITVQDNGIGIPPEDMDRIFERFYRVDKARSREFGGTGLGLAIAQEIVTQHGGNISLTSKPGEGTLVTITLPINRI